LRGVGWVAVPITSGDAMDNASERVALLANVGANFVG
jgi:hypothetical protein